MTLSNELDTISLLETNTSKDDQHEEYSIPLDISDIISICREYNKLGWKLQSQVENILEVGVEESIRNGSVRQDSLPFIKDFLEKIVQNAYFGDATAQAQACIFLLDDYRGKSPTSPLN